MGSPVPSSACHSTTGFDRSLEEDRTNTVCLPIRLQQKPRAIDGTERTVYVSKIREAIVRNDNMFTVTYHDSYPSNVPVSKNHRHDAVVLGDWNEVVSQI